MDKIESFKIDHLNLDAGLYVSRKDTKESTTITTFDLRMVSPNKEPVIDMPALHTIEHLGATYLRNCSEKQNVVYFGPMGCRTGFYLLMFDDLKSEDIYELIVDMCDFILWFEGEIPGAKAEECGNHLEQNLAMAKYYYSKYKTALCENRNFQYK